MLHTVDVLLCVDFLRYGAYHEAAREVETERVQMSPAKIQLFELTTARTVSVKAGGEENLMPCFAASDSRTLVKYSLTVIHHAKIFLIV
jgi:hypothetical protein